jgi:hypothetical protein
MIARSGLGPSDGQWGSNRITSCLPTIREMIVTSAYIDANHKLISDQKARDSLHAGSCSRIAGVSRRS